ncbi:hypothetical protein B0I32_105429 [Nonomuraea fuscirosea]|uniref:Uncharacterized protein n=1 Tax=Nonomuraea fuscirosea TaxID=1291556 RepID=A0A2T0N484_9ACTN|nr:hypothetical protein [Nonomuraea fuscirosea]PRX66989.1 hypothetical protein B0I32_105429 [Nonomuraea fuscirosea]
MARQREVRTQAQFAEKTDALAVQLETRSLTMTELRAYARQHGCTSAWPTSTPWSKWRAGGGADEQR